MTEVCKIDEIREGPGVRKGKGQYCIPRLKSSIKIFVKKEELNPEVFVHQNVGSRFSKHYGIRQLTVPDEKLSAD